MKEELFLTNQIQLENIIEIPEKMPDIESVEQILPDFLVLKKYIIKTPIGESAEGKCSNGNKLLINWTLRQNVIYISKENRQLHCFNFYKEYIHYIVLPLEAINMPHAFIEQLAVKYQIEEIRYRKKDQRLISEYITLTIALDKDMYEYCIDSYSMSNFLLSQPYEDAYESQDD